VAGKRLELLLEEIMETAALLNADVGNALPHSEVGRELCSAFSLGREKESELLSSPFGERAGMRGKICASAIDSATLVNWIGPERPSRGESAES
jgi:hypothetical protein